MRIEVTQGHIREADSVKYNNPITLALRAAGLEHANAHYADYEYVPCYDEISCVVAEWHEGDVARTAYLPNSVICFMRDFAYPLPVEPFSFELTYEDRRATGNWKKVCTIGTPDKEGAVAACCESMSGGPRQVDFRWSISHASHTGHMLIESTETQFPIDENFHCQRMHGWCHGWMTGKGL